jgi:hypothetical protein
MKDKIEELKKIKELLEEGIISKDEFNNLKLKIIGAGASAEVVSNDGAKELIASDNEGLGSVVPSSVPEKDDKLTADKFIPEKEGQKTTLKSASQSKPIIETKIKTNADAEPKPNVVPGPGPDAQSDLTPIDSQKKPGKIILLIVLIVAVIGGGYLVWDNYFNGIAYDSVSSSEEITVSTAYVLSGELNFRSEKNTQESSKIQTLYFGDRIELVGAAEAAVYDGDLKLVWQKAEWEGKTGWIAKSIDDVQVVGDINQYEDYQSLFSSNYDTLADYGKLKVWGYEAMIAYLKENDWLGQYTIRSDQEDIRKNGLRTILRYRNSLNEKDRDAPYDYIVLLESEEANMAMYLRADGNNSGYVAGITILPVHVKYLIKKTKGDEIFGFGYKGVNLIELDATALGTADEEGSVSGWFTTSSNEINWINERLVESNYALNILDDFTTAIDFVSENDYYDYIRTGSHTNSTAYWNVLVNEGDSNFYGSLLVRAGNGMVVDNQVTSEWKGTSYVTRDFDKMKLVMDVEEHQLLLYIRDERGNSITWYACVDKYLIELFVNERDGYYEEYGC